MRVSSRQTMVLLSLFVVLTMVLTACTAAVPAAAPGAAPAAATEAAVVAATASIPSGGEWWGTAAEKAGCKGVTLHGVSESTPPSNFVRDVIAPQFEKDTGIKVELETTSWNEMYDKAIKDMQAGSGIYDFVYIEQDIIYSYLANKYLTDITKALADNPDLKSPDFDLTKFTSFLDNFKDESGDVFGIPMEAFIKVYLYRKDLFEDPKIQTAFKEKYGYDLAPATTHQQ
jgi:multiple sugar transport system substrate-binding protein